MLTIGQLKHMSTLSGMTLLDAAADAVGKSPLPSAAVRPIDTQQPEALAEIIKEWEAVQTLLKNHPNAIDTIKKEVGNHWSGPAADSFDQYMRGLGNIVDSQIREAGEVIAALQDVKKALDDAESAYFWGLTVGAAALAYAVANGIAAVAGATPTGGLSLSALIPTAIAIAAALTSFYIGISKANETKTKALNAASQKMKARVRDPYDSDKMVKALAVKPPPEPTITGDGFGKIARNLDEQFYWDK